MSHNHHAGDCFDVSGREKYCPRTDTIQFPYFLPHTNQLLVLHLTSQQLAGREGDGNTRADGNHQGGQTVGGVMELVVVTIRRVNSVAQMHCTRLLIRTH